MTTDSMQDPGVYITVEDGTGDVVPMPDGSLRNHTLAGTKNVIQVVGKKIFTLLNDWGSGPNNIPYKRGEYGGIDALVLTHWHNDHHGDIPNLIQEYEKYFPIFTSETNKILMQPIMRDGLEIQTRNLQRDIEEINEQRKKIRLLIWKWNSYMNSWKHTAEFNREDKIRETSQKIENLEAEKKAWKKVRMRKISKQRKNLQRIKNSPSMLTKNEVISIPKELKSIGWKWEMQDDEKYSVNGINEWRKDEKKDLSNRLTAINDSFRKMWEYMTGLPQKEWISISDNIRIKLYNAGHMLGASCVVYEITLDDNTQKHILITGDLGRYDNSNGLEYPDTIDEPIDFLLIEGTYSDTSKHPDIQEVEAKMDLLVKKNFQQGWTLLIPVFQSQRMQDVLNILDKSLEKYETSFDSKIQTAERELALTKDVKKRQKLTSKINSLKEKKEKSQKYIAVITWGITREINAIYRSQGGEKYKEVWGARFSHVYDDGVKDRLDRKDKKTPAFIVASGWMLQRESSAYGYFQKIQGDTRNTCLFVGYQALNTPGNNIQTGKWEDGIVPRCRIESVSYSGHGSCKDLSLFTSKLQLNPNAQIQITHTEMDRSQHLEDRLSKLDNVVGSSAQVSAARIGKKVTV